MELVLVVLCCGTRAGLVAPAVWGFQCWDGPQGAVLGDSAAHTQDWGSHTGPLRVPRLMDAIPCSCVPL